MHDFRRSCARCAGHSNRLRVDTTARRLQVLLDFLQPAHEFVHSALAFFHSALAFFVAAPAFFVAALQPLQLQSQLGVLIRLRALL